MAANPAAADGVRIGISVPVPAPPTVVIAPPGAATDRAREQLRAVRDVGGTAIAICASDDSETSTLADHTLPVAGSSDEAVSPIAYCAPLELFAYHFAVNKGATMLGFDDANRMEVNFRQIFGSHIPAENGRRAAAVPVIICYTARAAGFDQCLGG